MSAPPPIIVFLTSLDETAIADLEPALGRPIVVRDADALAHAAGDGARTLLSFGTGVIVPPDLLNCFGGGAYNLHAASPDFPGRDPHHFAVYEGASRYGATLHVMTERVDDGPIVDVEMFDVPPQTRPRKLLDLANAAGLRILERTGPRLKRGETLPPLAGVAWGPKKRSRKDFLAMCRITPDIGAEEFERRLHAFDSEAYDNLFVELHGRRFRIDKSDRR